MRSIMIIGCVGLISLALTGCKYDRDDREEAIYNDVGETDIDRRVYATDRRSGRAQINPADNSRVAARSRFHEVGETSLDVDTPAPTVKAKKQEKVEKVKDVKPVTTVKPVQVEPQKPAPVVVVKPVEQPKPVSVARPVAPAPRPEPVVAVPVRRVPAPPPVPEYTAIAKRNNHSSVGEVDLGN